MSRFRHALRERFPLAFAGKGEPKAPLQVGIHAAIMEALPDLNPNEIQEALADYTGGPTYLRNLQAGATRIGLDGQPAGQVTETDAAWAALRLQRQEEKWARRRQNGAVQRIGYLRDRRPRQRQSAGA